MYECGSDRGRRNLPGEHGDLDRSLCLGFSLDLGRTSPRRLVRRPERRLTAGQARVRPLLLHMIV